jgi:hypothetical protein
VASEPAASAPGEALAALAEDLRDERSVISPHVVAPAAVPSLGMLAAAGPRAAGRGEYALVLEAVREGYLLHYGEGRIVAGVDPDLALLAGDYLYAIGLERLAALGDLEAVRELSDLISLASQIHDGSRPPERAGRESAALWLASATAIGCGAGDGHAPAKAAVRAGAPDAADRLWSAASARAVKAGTGEQLRATAFGIDFGAEIAS